MNRPSPERQLSELVELATSMTRNGTQAQKERDDPDDSGLDTSMPPHSQNRYAGLPGFLEAARAFSLSLFELDVLALVAAFEVEPSWTNGHGEAPTSGLTVAWLLERLGIGTTERATALSCLLPGARLLRFGVLRPDGDSKIKTGDRVVLLAAAEAVRHVEQLFRVSLEFF